MDMFVFNQVSTAYTALGLISVLSDTWAQRTDLKLYSNPYVGDSKMNEAIKLNIRQDVTAFIGDIKDKFSVFIQLSPEPVRQINLDYEGDINIFFAELKSPEIKLGNCNFEPVKNVKFSPKNIRLTNDECALIDNMCWNYLIDTYGIIPQGIG